MSDPAYIDHLNAEALESYDRLAEQGPDEEPDWDALIAEGDDWRKRDRETFHDTRKDDFERPYLNDEDTPEGGE